MYTCISIYTIVTKVLLAAVSSDSCIIKNKATLNEWGRTPRPGRQPAGQLTASLMTVQPGVQPTGWRQAAMRPAS